MSIMTRQGLIEAIDNLRVGKHSNVRAPHKPLTLLWALGRIWNGEPRLASYGDDAHEAIRQLLKKFGVPRRALHPEQPFWHLASDSRLWDIPDHERLVIRPGGTPTPAELKRHDIKAGLPDASHELLRLDRELLLETANLLLFGHFPESLHDMIRDEVGLPRDAMMRGMLARERAATGARPRDPNFRPAVLAAYEQRCAVCDFDLQIAGGSYGLQAAHIWSHEAWGPDVVPNGLALCGNHHLALDYGVIGLDHATGTHLLLVSNQVSGESGAFRDLLDMHGEPLRRPQEKAQRPRAEFIDWHRKYVFKGYPRRLPRA